MRKLPYLTMWDVTPCVLKMHQGLDIDGSPKVVDTWEGLVNFSEKAKRIQDKDGLWVELAGVIHVKGDIFPDKPYQEGVAIVAGQPERRIVGYSRPRNPDGTVNHTRLELI